jgi:hypothetical protein
MELDILRIRLCLCKIKYGGFIWSLLFNNVSIAAFYWTFMNIICGGDI